MDAFGKWLAGYRLPPTKSEPEERELPFDVDEMKDGTLMVTCRSCERRVELGCTLEEHVPGEYWCGGSPRCCP